MSHLREDRRATIDLNCRVIQQLQLREEVRAEIDPKKSGHVQRAFSSLCKKLMPGNNVIMVITMRRFIQGRPSSGWKGQFIRGLCRSPNSHTFGGVPSSVS